MKERILHTVEEDPWFTLLMRLGGETATSAEIAECVGLADGERFDGRRVKEIMRALGWSGPWWVHSRKAHGYERIL
jgi:hypothetical protein